MKEENVKNKYAAVIDPLTNSEMKISFEEVNKWIDGCFDVETFTDEQLRTIIAVLGTYLLEQDTSAEAFGCFVSA